jgi:hypothetical protein
MKNVLKIFAVVLVAAFLMVSCEEKGGTIEVKNSWSYDASVSVVKGSSPSMPKVGEGTLIKAGQTHEFEQDEDGVYLVCAISIEPKTFVSSPVTLLAGNSVTVTIKD